MKPTYKIFIHTSLILGLLIFSALQRNQYAWMKEFPSEPAPLPVDGNEPMKVVFTLLVLAVLIAGQIVIVRSSQNIVEKAISLGLIGAATCAWWFAFFL